MINTLRHLAIAAMLAIALTTTANADVGEAQASEVDVRQEELERVLDDDFPKVTELPEEIIEPNSVTPLSGSDAIAVHETVTRVYLAEDSRNGDALRQLVTEDFLQDHSIYGRLQGQEAFADFVLGNPLAFDRFRHMALNIVSRATGNNEAEAVSYILVLEVHPGEEADAAAMPRILAHGVVRDRLVKQNDQWRIAHRIYDQFAVTAAVVPDTATRRSAARVVSPSGAD